MARSYRYDPDDQPPRERVRADREKRDARRSQHYTPPPVTRTVTQRDTRNP